MSLFLKFLVQKFDISLRCHRIVANHIRPFTDGDVRSEYDTPSKHKPNYAFVDVFKSIFQELFLPRGYPSSVSPDYWDYQIWDTIQVEHLNRVDSHDY